MTNAINLKCLSILLQKMIWNYTWGVVTKSTLEL